MNRRRARGWRGTAAAAMLLAASALAGAEEPAAPPALPEVLAAVGQLRKMDLGAAVPYLVIDSVRGGFLTFDIPPIVKVAWGTDGKPVWLDDVKRGQWMRIRYIVKDGRFRAKRITLLPKPRQEEFVGRKKPGGFQGDLPHPPDIPPAPIIGEGISDGGGAPLTPPAMDLPEAPDMNPNE